jgi:hypothetical protein
MYFEIGTPKTLRGLNALTPPLLELKQRYQIAVIDDQPFLKAEALRNHKFQVVEIGDIKAIDQVSAYPVIVCDIRGVGTAFGSGLEGAHLIAEIRKAYPDKFIMSYSGAEFDMSYNESLSKVDVAVPKDAQTEYWVKVLEEGITTVGDTKRRWVRFRNTLLQRGVEVHDVFRLEQAFIKSLEKRDSSYLQGEKIPDEIKEVFYAFVRVALVQIIESLGAP